MSFDWTDFLAVADKLISMVADRRLAEGYYRTAIGRAYFAAINFAKYALPQQSLDRCPEDANGHGYVIRQYKNGTSRDHKVVGDDLERLRIIRNKADYRPMWGDAGKQCAAELSRAHRTIERVKNHPL